MAKRTTLFVAVFAALLSVTLSVQAQSTTEAPTMTWVGNANQTHLLFYTGCSPTGNTNYSNWQYANGSYCTSKYITGSDSSTALYTQNCYIYSTVENKPVIMDFGDMGVASVTVGDGTGTQTAVMDRISSSGTGSYCDLTVNTKLTVQKGGTVTTGWLIIDQLSAEKKGNVEIKGGSFTTTLTSHTGDNPTSSIAINNGSLTLSDGTLTTDSISIGANGTFTHSGGTLTPYSTTKLTITGNYTLGENASLKANGKVITVNGNAEFNGMYDLSAYTRNSLQPSDSSYYTVFSANSISMSDASKQAVGDALPAGWVATLTSTQIVLKYYGTDIVNYNYNNFFWKDSGDHNFFSAHNWVYDIKNSNEANGREVLGSDIGSRSQNVSDFIRDCFIYETGNNADVLIDYNDLGVASLTVGDGIGTRTAKVYSNAGSESPLNVKTALTVDKGGTVRMENNTPTIVSGTLTVNGGTYDAYSIDIINGGVLNLSDGTLNVGTGGITNTSGAYTINLSGGTIGTNGDSWSTDLTANIASDSTVTFAPDAEKSITWSGALTGNGGKITKTGDGTLTLSGANTYSGGTTISAGTLAVNNANGLGTGNVTINGGKLDTSEAGVKAFNNDLIIGSDGGALTTKTGNYSSFSSISGSGNLTTNGYVEFNGSGGYNGHITVASGFVCVDPGAVGTIDLTFTSASANGSNFKLASAGTLSIGALNSDYDSDLFTSVSQAMMFEIGAGDKSSSYAGKIRGIGGTSNLTIKKIGSGTLTLNRSGYVYGGSPNSIKEVLVNEGKIIVDASNPTNQNVFKWNAAGDVGFWGLAPITVNSGAELEFVKAYTSAPNDKLTLNSGMLTLDADQYINQLTLNSGTVGGSGKVQVGLNGTGEWSVKGGVSTVNNKMSIVKNGNNTTFTINFDKDSTLNITNAFTGDGGYKGMNVTFQGPNDGLGNINITSTNAIDNLGSITFNNMNGNIAAPIAGTVTVTKSGNGTVTFSGANTYTGSTTINNGELILAENGTIKSSSITVNSNGVFTLESGTVGVSNSRTATTVSGTLNVQSGNYYAGATTVNNGGTLTVEGGTFDASSSSPSHFFNFGTITVKDNGSLTYSGSGQFRITGTNAALNIEGGSVTVNGISYIGVANNGEINQSGGSATFNNELTFGWGNSTAGEYNLTNGTLTTTSNAGLWCGAYNHTTKSTPSLFTVSGGVANFNKPGDSFVIGSYYTSNTDPCYVANEFNLYSGTVNATGVNQTTGAHEAGAFVIQYGGKLNVTTGADTDSTGNGVLNADEIKINTKGELNLSSGTINVGSGGITHTDISGASDNSYKINLYGGTFGNFGASWETLLDAEIKSNAVTFAPSSEYSITWSGILSGNGGVTVDGAGTLEIFGANTYKGATTITNGELRLRQNGTLGAQTGTVNIDTNGQLTFGGDMTSQPTSTINNKITGTGTIVKQGASNFTVNLDGNLTEFTGDMTISGGTLSALMNGTNKSLKVTNLSGPGNLELRLASGNDDTTLPNLTNDGFTGVISLVQSGGSNKNKVNTNSQSFEGFTFNVNSGTAIYVEGAELKANASISGTGNSEGYGALRLHNNMSGDITVLTDNTAIGIDRSAFTISGDIASGAASGETTLVIKTVVDGNGAGTFTGNIADGTTSTLGIEIASGTHTFASGAGKSLTYTGATTVNSGATLNLSGANANLVNSSAVAVNGALDVSGYTGETMQLNSLTGTGNVNLGATPIKLNYNEGTTEFSGNINGTGNVTKTGAGMLTLTQEPAYTGSTTVEAGTLDLAAGGTLYGLSGSGTVSFGSNALTLSNAANADSTFAGSFEGDGNVTKSGEGTLTLTQAPAYTGSTTVENGTLYLTAGGTLKNLKGGEVDEETGEPVVNAVIKAIDGETKKDLVLSNDEMSKFIGSISAKKITKDGDGTLKLYAEASSGGISADKLVVSSGRLDMRGYFEGTLEIYDAVFSPGNSVGALEIGEGTYGGGFILNDAGAELLMEIGGSEIEDNDQLTIDGPLTINDGLIYLELSENSKLKPGEEFTALLTASNSGSLTNSLLDKVRTSIFTDLSYEQLQDGTNRYVLRGRLDPNAVPEPSTWALLLIGAAGMLYWRKRKNA